jgi:hypothetical protein
MEEIRRTFNALEKTWTQLAEQQRAVEARAER